MSIVRQRQSRTTGRHNLRRRRRRKSRISAWRVASWIGRMLFMLWESARSASRPRGAGRITANPVGTNGSASQYPACRKRSPVPNPIPARHKARSTDDQRLIDATSALVNLGFRKSEAIAAIAVAANAAGNSAEITTLVRVGLKTLAK